MGARGEHLDPAPGAGARKTRPRPQARSEAKRSLILDAAIRHFAKRGWRAARVEDIATELKIAKGSIFQYFKSKEGLFLEAYKRSALSIPTWTDVPAEDLAKGFFGVIRYWLEQPVNLGAEDWVQFKVVLMGTYGTDLTMKKEINRFLAAQDPYGTQAFVRQGIERGEVRSDIDPKLIASMLDWMMEQYEAQMLKEQLTPGLFRRHGGQPGKSRARIEQFLELLRGAIGAPPTR